jgi:hypothetical protein
MGLGLLQIKRNNLIIHELAHNGTKQRTNKQIVAISFSAAGRKKKK